MKTRKAQKQGNGGIKIEVEIGGEDSAPAAGGGVRVPSELLVPHGTARHGGGVDSQF
jgi:hypothetical protein